MQMLLRIREDGIACCPYACFVISAMRTSNQQDVRFCEMNHALTFNISFVQSFDCSSRAKNSEITIAQAHEQTGNATGVVDGQACVCIPGMLPRSIRCWYFGKPELLSALALFQTATSLEFGHVT